jgi:type I restriction enzyme, R subunit
MAQNKKNYKERLEPLSNKRMVFIFDECHRSQFGENHKAIKSFSQMPSYLVLQEHPFLMKMQKISNQRRRRSFLQNHEDIFEKQLHAYTITHAIDDKNVLKFHIDYFKGKGTQNPNQAKPLPNRQ